MTERHTCHAHGCTKLVPPRMFACRKHWSGLPRPVQAAILREYRPGQERDKRPSAHYMAVQRLAVMHTAFRPHDEDAARTCAAYLAEAVAYAEIAKRSGHGDPLEGLLPSGSD